MIIFLLLLAILIPQLIAFTITSILWPGPSPARSQVLLKLCLSVGIGFGILSCLFFLQLSLFGSSRKGFVSTQIVLLMLLIAIFIYRVRSGKNSPVSESSGEPVPRSRFHRILLVLFFGALVSATIAFVFITLKKPHGEWDAWAVFNMKARFLFRAGDYWRDLFSDAMGWAGPDYPLLIPAAIAGCWTLMGRETLVIPALIALLFTLATVGVVVCGVSTLRGKTQGLLAGLFLVCTPYFITHGADQYSDIPLAFFFATTIVLLHLQDRSADSGFGFLIIAGITTGLSAWTKNEGLLFLIAILASRFAVAAPKAGLKSYVRQMRFFAAGLIPILLVVIFFKATIAARNGLLFPTEGPTLAEKVLDFSRYLTILNEVVSHVLSFGNWAVSITPLLAFYLLLLGARVEEADKASVTASLLTLGIMLAGYSMTYVLSSRDVSWHIVTSIDRLISQLWPSLIFVFFLIVRTPEQALMKRREVSVQA